MDQELVHSDLRKMFVGGLSQDHTSEAGVAKIKEYFSKWGKIDEVVVLKKEVHSAPDRLFGFVTFLDVDDPDKCFQARPHYLEEGKELEVKRAVPKGPDNESHTHKTKKLFIANLPTKSDMSPEDLAAELQVELEKGLAPYGSIEAPVLVRKKDESGELAKDESGNPLLRGIAFVTCSSEDIADRLALARKSFEFKGRSINVKKSDPSTGRGGFRGGRGGGRGRGQSAPNWYGGGYGQGAYGYGAYGYGSQGSYDGGYGSGGYQQNWGSSARGGNKGGRGGRGGQSQGYHPAPY